MEQNSEQKKDASFSGCLNFPSSPARLQPRRHSAIWTNKELVSSSDQPITNLNVIQTEYAKTLHLKNIAVPDNDERISTSTEKQEGKVNSVTANLDKEKNIAFLLNELDVLRANNKKLQDQLSEKDKELKRLKLDLELQESVAEAKIAEKAAALVEEIHSTQHDHDEAIMARLKLASEERNDVCKQVRLLEQPLETLENINPEENDMTLQELLNRINNADTGMAIRRTGAIIVDRIYRTQKQKKKITAEEINALIEERDAVLAQCKRLEQELHHMKEQNQTSANNPRHLTAKNNQERALKEKMLAMQQEREAAIHQFKSLEEELQTLRIYYSLHQALSQEANLKDQFNSALVTYEKALKNKDDIVSMLFLQNEELVTQLQQMAAEKTSIELKFQQTSDALQDTTEKLQKLQRLVDVLRKKIGAGSIRMVI
ncbi:mirror-image polydactyly gene 1 protein isoform X2 [Pantherophis guttatus]|uniref:Mirror-image polydactyly gene 1 protein isoform X2 n=1 Tax=Pantherophis guttatus TaxID=94885 RepID=A0ABM3Z4U8_PANGU|nr:mirror-image polydactyly gene 1 protein isoform X2 [Pantherophis guttatus]